MPLHYSCHTLFSSTDHGVIQPTLNQGRVHKQCLPVPDSLGVYRLPATVTQALLMLLQVTVTVLQADLTITHSELARGSLFPYLFKRLFTEADTNSQDSLPCINYGKHLSEKSSCQAL